MSVSSAARIHICSVYYCIMIFACYYDRLCGSTPVDATGVEVRTTGHFQYLNLDVSYAEEAPPEIGMEADGSGSHCLTLPQLLRCSDHRHRRVIPTISPYQDCIIYTCPFAYYIYIYIGKQDLVARIRVCRQYPSLNGPELAHPCPCSVSPALF